VGAAAVKRGAWLVLVALAGCAAEQEPRRGRPMKVTRVCSDDGDLVGIVIEATGPGEVGRPGRAARLRSAGTADGSAAEDVGGRRGRIWPPEGVSGAPALLARRSSLVRRATLGARGRLQIRSERFDSAPRLHRTTSGFGSSIEALRWGRCWPMRLNAGDDGETDAFLRCGRPEEALTVLRDAIRLDPESANDVGGGERGQA
jgi:hypothetical protein